MISLDLAPGKARPLGEPPGASAPVRIAAFDRKLLARLALRLAMALSLLLLAGMFGIAVVRAAYAGRIYPGVQVGETDTGGMHRDSAAALLNDRVAALDNSFITFTMGGTTWRPTLAELGVTVDIDASLDNAMAIGREGAARDRFSSAARLMRGSVSAPLVISLDESTLDRWFTSIDQQLGLPAANAALTIAGTSVTITPSQNGIGVDRTAARSAVVAAIATLHPITLPLPTIAQAAAIPAEALEPTRAAIATALSQAVSITYGDRQWTITADQFAPFVTVAEQPNAAGLYYDIDGPGLAQSLAAVIGGDLDQPARNAVLGWDGKLVALRASRDGRELQAGTLADLVAASMFGDHSPVVAPVKVTKPEIDSNNLAAYQITTKLGSGSSNYEGSNEGRATNIAVGADLLNGTLVPPHGVFSFNHSIGEITADKGYVEAKVIQGDRVGRDIGGGICQVSTTVFRAAFLGGFPLIEAWPHVYRLPFYEQDGWEPGLDASIAQPEGDPFGGGDFRFQNPSDGWLLIQAYTDGLRVYVDIYGPDLGYTVDITGPIESDPIPIPRDIEVVDYDLPAGWIELTELPEEGLETRYIRTVYAPDGSVVVSDDYFSRFAARGNVYRVSPDMVGQSPAGGYQGDPQT